jgi:hypothetical protein
MEVLAAQAQAAHFGLAATMAPATPHAPATPFASKGRLMRCIVLGLTPNRSAESIWTEAIMGEQPGEIGLWREIQLLWPILLRWREYRVGDYMRAVQELHLETFDSSRKERAKIGSEK